MIAQFREALGAMKIDERVLKWMVTALKESHRDEKRDHDQAIARLQKQYTTLQTRLDAMYVDKLDGTVTREFFDRKSGLWREEQSKISAEIATHRNANLSYIDSGVRILELAQRAEILYQTQPMQERRKLLRFVFQNSTWKHGHLSPVYRKPFDFLVENYQRAKQADAGSATKMSINEIWLPGRDSNPRPIG